MGKAMLIRVNNQTGRQLTDVKVFSFSENGLADEEKRYGNGMTGSSSFYQAHHTVFNLPLCEFIMTGVGKFEVKDLRCPVGTSCLEPGKYSIMIWEEIDYPCARFIRD